MDIIAEDVKLRHNNHMMQYFPKRNITIFLTNKLAYIKSIRPSPSLYFTYQLILKEYSIQSRPPTYNKANLIHKKFKLF